MTLLMRWCEKRRRMIVFARGGGGGVARILGSQCAFSRGKT